MLDLAFVRDNLPLLEEKLRQRGMDPAEVLKDFREIDTQRRHAITQMETLKAERNRASEDIGRLMKSGPDGAARVEQIKEQTKALREKSQELEKAAEEQDARLRQILTNIPNVPHASVPVGHGAEANVEVRRWGTPPKLDFAPKPHWELGEQLGVLDMERATKLTGARFAHARTRLHRSPAPVSGEFRLDVRHGATAQVRRRFVPRAARRKRPLVDPHGRSARNESLSR